MTTTAITTTAATTTTATTPDIMLVTNTITPDNASSPILYAPATTPVRWLMVISKKMGTTLRISQEQAEVLRSDTSTPGYEALLNRTSREEHLLRALGAITPEEQELLKKTLYMTTEGRHRNTPIFQCIRIKYFTNVCSWLQDRGHKEISLQDFLNKIGLSSLYSEIGIGLFEDTFPDRYQPWDWDSVEFHQINCKDRGNIIAEVYTNIDQYEVTYADTYPSPWGSCMRCSEWSYDGYSLGTTDDCDYSHPVVAYATEDIDLAWVTDKSTGKTLARCLINNVERTVSRVYAVGLNLATYDYQKKSQKELKDKLLEFVGLPVDEHTGLKGCRFAPQFIDEDTIVAPYIDGCYYIYDPDNGIISDTGEFTCTEHNPPVVCREGTKCICDNCGDRCDEDNAVYFDGQWWCRHCVDEYLSYCVKCDEYAYTENSTYCEETGEWYCDSCAERYLTRCDHCDGWFLNDSVTFCSSDGHDYCESCMEDKDIRPCDSCGEYYFADELNEDMHCCHCCAADESEDTNE